MKVLGSTAAQRLPSCFPPLPPSPLKLRAYELYRSSQLTVLVKSDPQHDSVTFEFYTPCPPEGGGNTSNKQEEILRSCCVSQKLSDGGERGRSCSPSDGGDDRSNVSRKKTGVDRNNSQKDDNFVEEEDCIMIHKNDVNRDGINNRGSSDNDTIENNNYDINDINDAVGGGCTGDKAPGPGHKRNANEEGEQRKDRPKKMGYIITTMTPSSPSYPAFKGMFVKEEYRKGVEKSRCPWSHLMMNIFHRFLLLLIDYNEDKNKKEEQSSSQTFATGCVMRKVSVCKLLKSFHWRPTPDDRSFSVMILPPSRQDSTDTSSAKVNITRLTSRDMTIQALQSKLFTPRTCRAQSVELVSWETACSLYEGERKRSLWEEEGFPCKNIQEITVNSAYEVDISMLRESVNRVLDDGCFSCMMAD